MVLSREISSPSRKVLKSPFLHRSASTGCLTPGLTGSKAIPARELVKGRPHSVPPRQKGSLVSDA